MGSSQSSFGLFGGRNGPDPEADSVAIGRRTEEEVQADDDDDSNRSEMGQLRRVIVDSSALLTVSAVSKYTNLFKTASGNHSIEIVSRDAVSAASAANRYVVSELLDVAADNETMWLRELHLVQTPFSGTQALSSLLEKHKETLRKVVVYDSWDPDLEIQVSFGSSPECEVFSACIDAQYYTMILDILSVKEFESIHFKVWDLSHFALERLEALLRSTPAVQRCTVSFLSDETPTLTHFVHSVLSIPTVAGLTIEGGTFSRRTLAPTKNQTLTGLSLLDCKEEAEGAMASIFESLCGLELCEIDNCALLSINDCLSKVLPNSLETLKCLRLNLPPTMSESMEPLRHDATSDLLLVLIETRLVMLCLGNLVIDEALFSQLCRRIETSKSLLRVSVFQSPAVGLSLFNSLQRCLAFYESLSRSKSLVEVCLPVDLVGMTMEALVRCLERNVFFSRVFFWSLGQYGEMRYFKWYPAEFYTGLNRRGRRLLSSCSCNKVPDGLWPEILSLNVADASSLFYFLRAMPDLVRRRGGMRRKRNDDDDEE